MPRAMLVLSVYDVAGREVSRREVGGMGAGRHLVRLSASGALAPGIYVVRLSQERRVQVTRATVIRTSGAATGAPSAAHVSR